MSKKKSTDLAVIGAGPGGYPAAFHAADRGMKVTLIDPETNPGGVCLYRGCIPSKALLHVAAFLHEAEQASQWGVKIKEPEIDLQALAKWKNKVVKKLTGGLGFLTKKRSIEYIRGTARFTGSRTVTVRTHDGDDQTVEFQHAIVATGSRPASIPGVPDSPRIMTSRQALDLEEIPGRMLVVGGGYIGLELGQVYAALGSKITVVEMLDEILMGVDRDLVSLLSRRLDGQFENIMTLTKVKAMEEVKDGIRVSFDGDTAGEETFDKVLLSVGRTPVTDGLGLEEAGIELDDDGFIAVDDQRRTSSEAIYAIGDVAGQPMLAHKATHEARVAVEAIDGKKTVYDPRAIPFVVFTDPEIAWCGLTEQEASRRGTDTRTVSFPWSASGRALTISRQDGITKLLCDAKDGRILGAGIAGRGAGELLAEIVLAIEMGAVADDLSLTIHAHPTLSETIMEAAEAFSGSSTHFTKK